jgi:hypothetical protein
MVEPEKGKPVSLPSTKLLVHTTQRLRDLCSMLVGITNIFASTR